MSQNTIQPTAVLVRVTKNLNGPNPYSVIASQSHCFIHLNSSGFTIGRDRLGCQYTFDTLDVSRRHVMFEHDGCGWKITDLSSNGTWISFDDSHTKLDKNVATPLRNMNIITLKPCPEIRYVFIDNILPSDLLLSVCGSMTLSDLSQALSNTRRFGEKRQWSDSLSGVPEKRFCNKALSNERGDDNRRELAIIKEQGRLINELTRRLNAQSKLFNPENYTCSICLQVLVRPTTLVPCQHVFCNKCISAFREHMCAKKTAIFCPLCRSKPMFFFVNKSCEDTIDLVLQSSLTDQEMIERKRIEQEYSEDIKNVRKAFRTVQSEFCLPPVYLTDSNEMIEIGDLEDFFEAISPGSDSDDESDGSTSDADSETFEEIQQLLLEESPFQDLFDSDQTLLITPSF